MPVEEQISETKQDHWNDHAKQWHYVKAPLKPAPEDVALMEELVRQSVSETDGGSVNAVLLGVTPELARMNLPAGGRLLSVDRCQSMISTHGVGPDDPKASSVTTICSNWCDLPVESETVDVVIGDGCYTVVGTMENYHAVTAEASRVLKPEGHYLMRFFVRPDQREEIETLVDELQNGRIGNFHIFKFRLAMSLHGTLEEGVRVGDVWEAWNAQGIDVDELAQKLGWTREEIMTINAYRNVDTRYFYPTLAEARETMSKHFEELSCHILDYEFGTQCPTLYMKKRTANGA